MQQHSQKKSSDQFTVCYKSGSIRKVIISSLAEGVMIMLRLQTHHVNILLKKIMSQSGGQVAASGTWYPAKQGIVVVRLTFLNTYQNELYRA